MKINKLDAHDRLMYVKKTNSDDIGRCCQDIINQCPFGDRSFYIFAHKRELGLDERYSLFLNGYYVNENGIPDLSLVPSHRMIWQPRLTKPKAVLNSMLFKATPGSENVEVKWILPERELWEQYQKGNLTESQIVIESIDMFENHRELLERADPDDAKESEFDSIYTEIAKRVKVLQRKI